MSRVIFNVKDMRDYCTESRIHIMLEENFKIIRMPNHVERNDTAVRQ